MCLCGTIPCDNRCPNNLPNDIYYVNCNCDDNNKLFENDYYCEINGDIYCECCIMDYFKKNMKIVEL